MEKSTLEEFNHWWIKHTVDPDLALPFRRDSYTEIERNLQTKFITAFVGLRRVGKTVTMYQLIKKLIEEKKPLTNILFFSFDDMTATVRDVIETYRELHGKDFREEKTYIFFDEIQKCDGWENELKKYYDLYPKLKFVISGSESLFIRKKTKETLAGRIFEFNLTPFTFKEYLRFNGLQKEDEKYETRIWPHFITYAKKGGFPETFSMQSDKIFKEYIQALVLDKIVYKDIPKLFSIDDPEFLKTLTELIARNPGMYVDYQSLSKQYGKDRRVIKNYIAYLKDSFLITVLGNYRKGSTTLRKKKRAYPTDNALISLYANTMDDRFFGRLVETLAINHLQATAFWTNSNEIDVVKDGIPIEIKYQNTINTEDYKPLKEFMKKFGKSEGIIVTKKEEGELKLDCGTIKLIPVCKWLLS